MSRSAFFFLVGTGLCLAIVAAVLFGREEGRGTDAVGMPGGDGLTEASAELIPGVMPGATLRPVGSRSGAEATEGRSRSERVEAVPSVASVPQPGPPPAPWPVQGVLLDGAGRPLAGVPLTYLSEAPDSVRFERLQDRLERIRPFRRHDGASVSTDARGEFTFDGPDRREGGAIRFDVPDYLEGHVVAPIDPSADWQTIQALPTPHQDSTCTFWLTGSRALEPVDLEGVRVEPLAGSFEFPRRRPRDDERSIELEVRGTKVVQRGVPPGRWQFTFLPRHGLHQRVDVLIEEPGTEQQITVLVESWPDGLATDLEFEPAGDGTLPWIDTSTGMDTWLPEERLEIGELRLDRHFARTLRIGHGPVKAAELTLRLRALSSMSRNDAIYLEHRGSREFAWRSSIEALLGRWRSGSARTLYLDLARLPLASGETYDLRPSLEDGLLDVVIQDDTAIEAMSIRILR
ncbi:hypothetical protein [Planctomycetes bacterium Poly30]